MIRKDSEGLKRPDPLRHTPEALKKKKKNFADSRTADPLSRCYLPSVPRITYIGLPFRIVYIPSEVVVLYEWRHVTRALPSPTRDRGRSA